MSENRGDPPQGSAPETGNAPSELRDLIAETYKEQQKEPPPAPPAGGSSDTDALARAGAPAASGDRGGDSREDDRKPPAEPPPGAPPPPPGEGGEAPPPPAAAAGVPAGPPKAPDHWSAEDRELFGSLSSDDDRSKFLRLNARREAGLTPRLQRAADLERGYGEVEQLFQPWTENLRAQNRAPKDVIKIWYEVERGLTNKETQDEIIANIIAGYGANPTNIARHLNARRGFANPPPGAGDGPPNGGQPNGAGGYRAADPGAPPPVQGGQTVIDPALEARFQRLESTDRVRAENELRANMDAAARAYHNFADARDSAGNLLHPFLAEVESQMTTLAQLDRAQGKMTIDLQDLYDRAAWATPSTRERLLADREASEARKAADERKAKADAARRAGSSVTGAPGPGQAPQDLGTPDRSIRDEIRAQMPGRN